MDPLVSIQQCPACRRIVHFSHSETTLLRCLCGSVLQRKEGVLLDKPFHSIQQPVAIIQPGTEGKWNGKTFKVLGRFRAWMKEAVYNYWTILFDDATIGYLGEGYGLYAVFERSPADGLLTSALLDGVNLGKEYNVYQGATFLLTNKNTCYKWEIEGEVYIPEGAPTFRTFSFAASDGRFAEVIEFRKDHIEVFNVSYVSFPAFTLTNTRSWEPYGKELSCIRCLKQNTLKTFPYAQSYACIHCGAGHALQESGDFKLQEQRKHKDAGTSITLGASGLLKGINYEVIGYALKEESNIYRSKWKEYTLFNPVEGFAFLSEYEGNWIYIREQGSAPVLVDENDKEFTFDNEPFLLFNRYGYKTLNAAGEFPHNLFNDGEKIVREFISPPEVWIREESEGEGVTWFLGDHISRKELKGAFGEAITMPYKGGIGAVEPMGFVSSDKIVRVTFVSVLVLVFTHIISTVGLQERILSEQEFSFGSRQTVSSVTPKFQLEKSNSTLQFDLEAPVDNSWFEFNATLVNAGTGAEYSLGKGVEYYHGYSDGESWSEGSSRETVYLKEIPAGTYYLQISGTREEQSTGQSLAGYRRPDTFSVRATYDTANHRNLVVCVIFLLIAAFIQFLVVQYNERSRWSNSPFSPD